MHCTCSSACARGAAWGPGQQVQHMYGVCGVWTVVLVPVATSPAQVLAVWMMGTTTSAQTLTAPVLPPPGCEAGQGQVRVPWAGEHQPGVGTTTTRPSPVPPPHAWHQGQPARHLLPPHTGRQHCQAMQGMGLWSWQLAAHGIQQPQSLPPHHSLPYPRVNPHTATNMPQVATQQSCMAY
jgi:hypothetical protein